MRAVGNYVIVEMKKQTTIATQTKSGIYLMNQEKTDTTRDGDKIVTTEVTVIDVGPDAKCDVKPGDSIALNYYMLQVLPEKDGHIYGVIPDNEIKVVF